MRDYRFIQPGFLYCSSGHDCSQNKLKLKLCNSWFWKAREQCITELKPSRDKCMNNSFGISHWNKGQLVKEKITQKWVIIYFWSNLGEVSLFTKHFHNPQNVSVTHKHAVMLFCCETPEMFCGLPKLPSTFHQHGAERIIPEFSFLGEIFL